MVLFGGPAVAVCHLPRPRLVCAEYFQSKAVVIARLAGITPLKDSYGDVTGTYYSLTVERTLSGKAARLFRIYEGNDSGRSKFNWKTGDSYLLFLHEQDANGSWLIDGCGNSSPTDLSRAAIEDINAIDSASNHSLIQGLVWDFSMPGPVAGVQVEARGPGGVFAGKTQENGRFEMHVPPGKYQVKAVSAGKSFAAGDLTYENPDKLTLENGGCAQVQFVGAKNK
jgi:hypothetical protein